MCLSEKKKKKKPHHTQESHQMRDVIFNQPQAAPALPGPYAFPSCSSLSLARTRRSPLRCAQIVRQNVNLIQCQLE